MNELLELKGHFETRKNQSVGGMGLLPKGCTVEVSHLLRLRTDLEAVLKKWTTGLDIGGALVSVHYTKIVAKSNRIGILLSEDSSSPAKSIRGAKFEDDPTSREKRHVFTHFVSFDALRQSIEMLSRAAKLVQDVYGGVVSDTDGQRIAAIGVPPNSGLSKSACLRILRDAAFVVRFDVDESVDESFWAVIPLFRCIRQALMSAHFSIQDLD